MGAITKAVMPDDDALFSAVAQGDLSKLSIPQKLAYYNRRCQDLGLNPLNQPFQWLMLNGKLTLYANRACSEELRATRRISIQVISREISDDCYVVTVKASTPDGRVDENLGAVNIAGLKGEAKANAMMKAHTKACRRATLSICGLGMLDELEVAAIPTAKTLQLAAGEYEKGFQHIIDKAEGKVSADPHTSADDGGGGSGLGAAASEEIPAYEEAMRCEAKLVSIKHPPKGGVWLEFEDAQGKAWAAAVVDAKWIDFLTAKGVKAGWTIDLTVTPVETEKGTVYRATIIHEVKAGETPLEAQLTESVKAVKGKKKAEQLEISAEDIQL